jgi:hypothetical protein
MKILAKKRADRYQSMDEVADQLEKVLGKRLAPRIGGGAGSLPPLPPPSGAELQLPPQPATVPDVAPPTISDDDDDKPTALFTPAGKRKRRNRASTHDPPFVQTARPGYDSLEEPDDFLATLNQGSSKAPIFIALLILGLGIGVAGYFVWSKSSGSQVAAADAGAAAVNIDAAAVAAASPDAGPSITNDAGAIDAATGKTATSKGKGKGEGKGKGKDTTPAVAGWSNVEVITRPAEGSVYIAGIRRGPDGVTLRERRGTTLKIKCGKLGYKDGFKTVKVTKPEHTVVCTMKKKPRCVPGVKNPFEDCP